MVIFSSDNGSHQAGGYDHQMHNSNAPFRGGKRDLYEGGIRVPTIAWWPGTINAGSRTNHISAFWDFAPTTLELAGLEIPDEMDGISYLPTLVGQPDAQTQHNYLYWEINLDGGRQAVRYAKWKAVRLNVRNSPDGEMELYDILKDPGETTNLAKQYPTVVAQIDAFMREAHCPPQLEAFRLF